MRKLLVVEDDSDSLEMLSLLLETGGYDVHRCLDGASAIRALETTAFELVLADLLLGDKSLEPAWSTIDRIVELARPVHVGLITGWTVTPAEAKEHGVAFVLQKPASRQMLFERVAESLHLEPVATERERIVREYFRAIEQSSFTELGMLCTQDVLYQVPGIHPRFAKQVTGRDAFVAFTKHTFSEFPETHFDISSIRPLPSGALVEYIGSWLDGNQTRRMPGAVMLEFKDELICRINVRVNSDALV